jgi:hypothetical protein
MINLTRVSPDSFDVRKSPLIPALVVMTMTSFTPLPCTVNLVGSNPGIMRGATAPNVSREGLSLFLEELERHSKKQAETGKLAKSKGIDLPDTISNLPDETVKLLADQGVTPDFINPSQEDSLIIEFTADSKYYMAEFYNDGEIILLVRGNNGRDIWGLNSDNYLKKLKQELVFELEPSLID